MALRICGSGALRWFLASGLALACTASMAQDAKEAVAVEAAKVVAAPLSEQVTAIGTLLSDEAVTVSSEIPGRLKEIHFQEGQPVEKGAPLFTLDEFGLSRPARRCRGQAQACRADPPAGEPALQEQIRDGAVGRRSDVEPCREHGHGRARPRAAREGAHRGAVLRHCRFAPCERRRIHHRRSGARQSGGHRSGEGGFQGA